MRGEGGGMHCLDGVVCEGSGGEGRSIIAWLYASSHTSMATSLESSRPIRMIRVLAQCAPVSQSSPGLDWGQWTAEQPAPLLVSVLSDERWSSACPPPSFPPHVRSGACVLHPTRACVRACLCPALRRFGSAGTDALTHTLVLAPCRLARSGTRTSQRTRGCASSCATRAAPSSCTGARTSWPWTSRT